MIGAEIVCVAPVTSNDLEAESAANGLPPVPAPPELLAVTVQVPGATR